MTYSPTISSGFRRGAVKTPGRPEENVFAAVAPGRRYPAAGILPFFLTPSPAILLKELAL